MQSKLVPFVLVVLTVSLCAVGPLAAQPDVTESDVYNATLAELEITLPDGSTDHCFLTGPATMLVYFEGPQEGIADDDDRNGRDEVDTELVALTLTGTGVKLGPLSVALSPTVPTRGQLEEEANQIIGRLDVPPFALSGSAGSDLGLHIAVLIMGQTYSNASPLDLFGVFHHKPAAAGDVLEGHQSVELLDVAGQPSGFRVKVIRWWLHAMIEVDESSNAELAIDLRHPDGTLLPVHASGLMRQHVFFEGPVEGSAVDDDGDALEEVSTQIVALDLDGFEPSLGSVQIGIQPSSASYGEIEEQWNGSLGTLDLPPFAPAGPADSFFDVFVEVEVGGQSLRNEDPIRVEGPISNKPPGSGDVLSSIQNVMLVDAVGQPSGFTVEATQLRFSRVVEIDQFQAASFDFELWFPTGPEIITTTGSMTMHVFFEGAVEGSAVDDDSDGLEDVRSEMVQLDLAGVSTNVGPIQVRLLPGTLAPGEIEEQANAVVSTLDVEPFVVGGTASGAVDMVLRFDMMGQLFCTAQPLHLEGVITHKPARAGDLHRGTGNPVQLLDVRTGSPTGIAVSGLDAWFSGPPIGVVDEPIPSLSGLDLKVWPNPLNPQAVISYRVPQEGLVSLAVFDVRGRRVRELFEGARERGEYRAVWNGRDDAGTAAASGAYLIRLSVDGALETCKLTIVW